MAYKTETWGGCGRRLSLGRRRRSLLTVHLKPYWGKPAVRNFRGGRGNPKFDRARRAPLPYSAQVNLKLGLTQKAVRTTGQDYPGKDDQPIQNSALPPSSRLHPRLSTPVLLEFLNPVNRRTRSRFACVRCRSVEGSGCLQEEASRGPGSRSIDHQRPGLGQRCM